MIALVEATVAVWCVLAPAPFCLPQGTNTVVVLATEGVYPPPPRKGAVK